MAHRLRSETRPTLVVLSLGLATACCSGQARTVPHRDLGARIEAPIGPDAGLAIVDAATPRRPVATELCNLAAAKVAHGLPSATPFERSDPICGERDPFCDSARDPPDTADTCFVAQTNLARAEREARDATRTPSRSAPWDGVVKPRYLDRIDAHLHLVPAEHAMLEKHGFVVLDRLAYPSYAEAFHDIFQEQLPVYVSPDPILHAVTIATENRLETIEKKELAPLLGTMLRTLGATLQRSKGRYDRATFADLDAYLGVAFELGKYYLVRAEHEATASGDNIATEDFVGRAGLEQVSLFGRQRMIDFSQFTPRGHYAGNDAAMAEYFRVMMWLSRLEFNLVSRSCRSSQPGVAPDPSETPRETRDAMALADLVARAGVLGALQRFDAVYSEFAGSREDVSIGDLRRLAAAAHTSYADPKGPEKLRAAIGDKFRRTARTHFMPEGARELPAIATMFGPRIVPDVAPLTELVHDKLPGRYDLSAADVGYTLGHDRAKAYLGGATAQFPALAAQLDVARAKARSGSNGNGDLYGSWFRSLLSLSSPTEGAVPSFMKTDTYADARMNSALVGFGQLRHAYVLVAGQGYDAYGCEIPDGYVEPLVPLYDGLIAHVRRLRAVGGPFARFEAVLAMLRSISATEIAGGALSEPQRRWLGMVAEAIPSGGYSDSGAPPKWTGWYFDMFEDREHGAARGTAFIADYFTLTNTNDVAYLGSDGVRLGVFVVDVGGEPRAMVGPVAKGFEAKALIQSRLSDQDVFTKADRRSAWRASYAAPDLPTPPVGLVGQTARCTNGTRWNVVLTATKRVGPVAITLLDHHGDPMTETLTADIGEGRTVLAFELGASFAGKARGPEGLHVRIANLAESRSGAGTYDYFTAPSVYQYPQQRPQYPGLRPRGIGPFGIGAAQPE